MNITAGASHVRFPRCILDGSDKRGKEAKTIMARFKRSRGGGMRQILMIILGLIVFAQIGTIKLREFQEEQKVAPVAEKYYDLQVDCEAGTRKPCSFTKCDDPASVPGEPCGAARGWRPAEEPALPDGGEK
jgi:hypothetical protein